jgi:hypothetical protein
MTISAGDYGHEVIPSASECLRYLPGSIAQTSVFHRFSDGHV